jgi:aminocarboxymuconate-semialdehyde decarboxylase
MNRKRQLIVDIHQHFVPDAFFDAVRSDADAYGATLDGDYFRLRSGLKFKWSPRQRDPRLRIRDMDESRVDVAALSLLPPFFSYAEAPEVGRRISSLVNDALIQIVRDSPDRFVAMGHVPLQDVDASIAELERRRFSAVQIGSNVNGRNLDDPLLLPFFQAAERLGTFILVHPTVSDLIGADRLNQYHLRNLIGNVTDTAVAIASVIFGGVLDRCPNLKICFAHGGGSAPSIWGRWEHGQRVRREPNIRTTTSVAELRQRIYVDTLTHSASALRFLIGELGPGRVLLGSDYPADMADNGQVATIESLGLADDAVEKILGGTASVLLGNL